MFFPLTFSVLIVYDLRPLRSTWIKNKKEVNQLGRTKCTVHAIVKSNSVIWGYSHDIGMTFLLEQVHFISMYFSVLVYMIPKQTFIQCKSFRTEFQIENWKSCSLGQVAHACLIGNHMSENALFEPVDFIM